MIIMIKQFNIFLFIIFILTFMGCSTTRYATVSGVEKEVTNHKDSIRIRDSIVVIPIERIVDVVPSYDTLKMETTQARAKAYVDTTLHLLKGSIENKDKAKTEVREVIRFVEKIDTLYIEKPIPYKVEKQVRYVPSFFKFTALFFVGVILLIIIRIVLKYKGL